MRAAQWLGGSVPDWVWLLLAAPFIGSFLCTIIRRLPAGRTVVAGRSCCEACATPLAPWDMVPLLSFVWLRGSCRSCGAPIPPMHLHVELASIAIAASAAIVEARTPFLVADCVFGWWLLALGWIDWRHGRLPDVLTLPLILAGLAATALLTPDQVTDHAVAAAIGYALFRLVSLTYRALRGRDGLGEGDAKLLAAIGAWVGVSSLPQVLLVAALSGIAFIMIRSIGRGFDARHRIAFGPHLMLGAWCAALDLFALHY
jgi:leader peptidase (prepilin peptidase)/N-methyltransferase